MNDDLLRIEDGHGTSALVDVERGGTLRSFRLADGWELFAQGTDPAANLAPGDAFARSGFTGHVECLPTIDACTVPGLPGDPLVDHGALWQVPWAVVEADSDEQTGSLRLFAELVGWPVIITRTVVVAGSTLALEYELANNGADAVPILWAGHGLLSAPAGTRVQAEVGAPPWRVGATPPDMTVADVERLLLGVRTSDGLALDDLGDGGWVKAYTSWPSSGAWLLHENARVHVRAEHPSGALRLGLWLNNRGFPLEAPLRHVALEPTTGDGDDLSDCVRRDSCWWVPGGSSTTWTMSYTVHHATTPTPG
jgi:galactose mutarotase-like enzyme